MQSGRILRIIRQVIEVDLYETDMIALITILMSLSQSQPCVAEMIQLNYESVFLKELNNFNPPVAQGAAKILANCLSMDEDIDFAFIKAGILQAFQDLVTKHKLKEFQKLREKVTFIVGNLLCSSLTVFTAVIKSPLIEYCLAQLAEEFNEKVDSTKQIKVNIIEIFRTFYLRGEEDFLYHFTKQNPGIVTLVLNCTGKAVSPELNIKCLIIVNKILGLGDSFKTSCFLDIVYQRENCQKLEVLQLHDDINVYNFVSHLLNKYFEAEADDD